MAPPAKRRRKNVVDSSDEEADRPQDNILTRFLNSSPNPKAAAERAHTASPSPLKRVTRAANRQNGVRKSPSVSPEKPRARAQKKAKVGERGKTADLLTLFSNQAQKSQSSTSSQPAPRPSKPSPADEIISDPISSDEDDVPYPKAHAASIVGEKARKRLRNNDYQSALTTTAAPAAALNPSQMFVRPKTQAQTRTRVGALDDDLRPWSERFGPVNLDELAVHKKKVADVRRWIEGVLRGATRQKLLLLKGAAGTGKTTTVRLLARDMGCELLEWRSPTGSFVPGMQSPSAQFEAFLGLGGKFGALDTDSSTENQPNQASVPPTDSKRIILIEEFPNTFTRASTALTSFRNAISAYLEESTPSFNELKHPSQKKPVTPIILVVSETLLTTTSASADSFTAHRLLGPEIMRHPKTGMIEFNAIAPSILTKALELVVLKEARKSGRRRTPGPQVLKRLGEIGDIRSAVSSLEFLCLKGDGDADWGAKVSFTKPKGGARNGIALTRGEAETLEQVSQREASLGIFHAVGKVVYNKRDDPGPGFDPEGALPDHLRHCARPKRSQVSVDTLIDETGADTSTFISALHENYALSCEAPGDEAASVDHLNGCLEALSDSDLLCPSWDVFFGARGSGGGAAYMGRDSGSHVVRQDEMAFQVAVRGMLFALPHPVKRVASSASGPGGRGGAGDAFKMFYPTSIKLWRAKEEMESLIDVWSAKLLSGEENAPTRNVTDGASLFLRNAGKNRHASAGASFTSSSSNDGGGGAAPLLSLGSAARRELILDRLPYMAHIGRGHRRPGAHSLRQRDIEKVVSFRGIGAAAEDEDVVDQDEEGAPGDEWATDKPYDGVSPRKKKVAGGIKARGGGRGAGTSVAGLQVQKLVLSDDDIESD